MAEGGKRGPLPATGDSATHATEKNLEAAAEVLDKESYDEILEAVAASQNIAAAADLHAVQVVRDRLEAATLPLAATLMDGVAKAAIAGKKLDEV